MPIAFTSTIAITIDIAVYKQLAASRISSFPRCTLPVRINRKPALPWPSHKSGPKPPNRALKNSM